MLIVHYIGLNWIVMCVLKYNSFKLVRAKCVRCPSGVVDGLRGKRKWPLLMALFFFFLLSSHPVTFLPEGVDLGS
jgi:hypothetical protein